MQMGYLRYIGLHLPLVLLVLILNTDCCRVLSSNSNSRQSVSIRF